MEHAYQAIIDAVNQILNDDKLSTYTVSVVDRLVSFGYTPVIKDVLSIAFSMEKSNHHITNQINQPEFPEGLREIYVDMACGEFLNTMYQTGQLAESGIDAGDVIQSITEGDTSVTFATSGENTSKIKVLIDYLLHGRESDFICYRRLRW